MKNPIDIRFKYKEEEYVEAVKWFYLHSGKMVFDMILSTFLLISTSIFAVTGGANAMIIALLALSVIFLLMVLVMIFVSPRRSFRQEARLREVNQLTFTQEGIGFKIQNIRSTMKWHRYTKIKENERFYYLVYGKYLFTIVPKRAIAEDKQEPIRSLLQEKLKL